MEPTAKERILKKIRKGLIQTTEQPFPSIDTTSSVYPEASDSLDVIFAEEFTKIQGHFVYSETVEDFIESLNALCDEKQWNNVYCWEFALQQIFQQHDFKRIKIGDNIEKADAGVTLCEGLVARSGSILLSSKQKSGRSLPVFPPVHLAVAYSNQLFYDLKEALQMVVTKYNGTMPSMISVATGPSRTADIEKTLVLGAHGPKEVYVFLIDQPA